MSSLSSKPSIIIWPKYLQELSILITVSFIITEVPGFIFNFSGIKYMSTVFCSLNFSPNFSENCSHSEAIHSFQKQLVTLIPGHLHSRDDSQPFHSNNTLYISHSNSHLTYWHKYWTVWEIKYHLALFHWLLRTSLIKHYPIWYITSGSYTRTSAVLW